MGNEGGRDRKYKYIYSYIINIYIHRHTYICIQIYNLLNLNHGQILSIQKILEKELQEN